MSYLVIARKWRPQTFDEVTGQEPITRTLRNAIEHDRLHHAYLFSGARGVGKTTTARLLAKALNCHQSDRPTPTPCRADDPLECSSCREIAGSRSIDVLEIDAASNTGVDNVRDAIIGSIGTAPARDRYKVFIIDEVHMLSGPAFNALLKTLEEPPPRVVFIMATTEKHKLPDTILSRCQQFEFRTIATAKIVERLRLIAGAEKISISEDALREVARAGEGSMRDAQSAFDQVISFSGPEIRVEDVEMALGIAPAEMLARVIGGIAEQKPAELLAVVDDLVMRGHDLRNFCRDLLSHLRDLLVANVAGDVTELLEASGANRKELERQASFFSESDLVRFFHSLTETENNLRTAAQPRYQLEIGLIKLMEMRRIVPLAQLVERLTALEEALRTGTSPAVESSSSSGPGGGFAPERGGKRGAAPGSATPRASAARESAPPFEMPDQGAAAAEPLSLPERAVRTPPAPGLTLVPPTSPPVADVRDDLAEEELSIEPAPPVSSGALASVVEKIKVALEKRKRMFLVVALEGARRLGLEGDELSVEFAPESRHLRDSLAKPESVKVLREACREAVGHDLSVVIRVREPGEADDRGQISKEDEARLEKQRLREMAEQHPTVQHMLRTFRGQIVDVRRVDD